MSGVLCVSVYKVHASQERPREWQAHDWQRIRTASAKLISDKFHHLIADTGCFECSPLETASCRFSRLNLLSPTTAADQISIPFPGALRGVSCPRNRPIICMYQESTTTLLTACILESLWKGIRRMEHQPLCFAVLKLTRGIDLYQSSWKSTMTEIHQSETNNDHQKVGESEKRYHHHCNLALLLIAVLYSSPTYQGPLIRDKSECTTCISAKLGGSLAFPALRPRFGQDALPSRRVLQTLVAVGSEQRQPFPGPSISKFWKCRLATWFHQR